jgi:metallo-beta-lactamase family protein
MVGYAEPFSLGGRIRNGESIVKIFGEDYEVKADVVVLDSYSAHADYKEMIQYFKCLDKSKVGKVFLVHGEYETQIEFKQKLSEVGFTNIEIPNLKDEFIL